MTREEAIKILKTERYCQEDTPILKQVRKAYDMAIEALQADTVEVVRCKDCVYWKYRVNYKGDEWGACLFLEDVEHWTEDTDFCSYGERNDKYKGGDV